MPDLRHRREPLILEIKGNSLDDGPGIRTVVFLKGCPLDCSWCHNPESKRTGPELSFEAKECIGCGSCEEACPRDAVDSETPGRIDRALCDFCLQCVDACPSGALSMVGRSMTVDDVVREVVKDKPFFDTSGGGATLSGGEPTMFMDYCAGLVSALHGAGVRTILETCGQFDVGEFERKLLPGLDAVYFDIKLLADAEHREQCGTSNRSILANFQSLMEACPASGVELLPRIPLIPGITATRSNLTRIASFLKASGARKAALLEYNPLWVDKERKLGRPSRLGGREEMHAWMDRSSIVACREIFSGLELV